MTPSAVGAPPKDTAELVAALQKCLALADRLNLPMVAIHIEQARSWMVDHGMDCDAVDDGSTVRLADPMTGNPS